MNKNRSQALLLSLALALTGCASAPTDDTSSESNSISDPLEGFNRVMWTLNYDYLDPYFVRPVSLAYVDYVPSPIRTGLSNFFDNLDEPSSMINSLIMGNGQDALDHFTRFWLNSTLGLAGLIDIASAAGIEDKHDKAFGDAVGHYGVGDGPYVMLPGYGPWTLRDGADVVDSMYVPLSLLNFWTKLGKAVVGGMEARASVVNQESLLRNSPDPYALTRDAYIQRQAYKAEVDQDDYNAEEEEYLDDYLEDF